MIIGCTSSSSSTSRQLRHFFRASARKHYRRGIASTPTASHLAAELAEGFSAQASGQYYQALQKYRELQRTHSPLIKALAGNAEALLLLRAPLSPKETSPRVAFDTTPEKGGGSDSFAVGDEVLAPWAEDGGEYPASIVSIDVRSGLCEVDWEDGGTTCRTVPLASLSKRCGALCPAAMQDRPLEVQAWCVRRALRRALLAWEVQAQAGIAHDAFVDIAGLLGDTALGELHAALRSPGRMLLADGLGHARRHLQRARWLAERSYAPDPLALATLCSHRAELLRLSAAAAQKDGATAPMASFREVLALHERASMHFTAATSTWRKRQPSSKWRRLGGDVHNEVVQELLWAKALASVAAAQGGGRRKGPTTVSAAGKRHSKGSNAPRHRQRLSQRSSQVKQATFDALPEKLLPPTPGLPREVDPLLKLRSPARAAAERAWSALELVAGLRTPAQRHAPVNLWTSSPAEAAVLANAVPEGHMLARMLLEVSVLVFAMGCAERRGRWARSMAGPLAAVAEARLLQEPPGTIDDCALASRIVAGSLCRRELMEAASQAVQTDIVSRDEVMSDIMSRSGAVVTTDENAAVKQKWSLTCYNAIEELFVVCMNGHLVHLPAPPPLTWYLEGLALSQTAPPTENSSRDSAAP